MAGVVVVLSLTSLGPLSGTVAGAWSVDAPTQTPTQAPAVEPATPTVVPGVPAPWLLVPGVQAGPGARSVPEAAALLARADAALADLDARAADANAARSELAAEREALDARTRELTDRLASSRARAQEAAVQAYIGGGEAVDGAALLVALDPLEAAQRQVLGGVAADAARLAAEADASARAEADDDVLALADRVATIELAERAVVAERPAAEAARALAVADLAAAQHEDDLRHGRVVVRSGDDGGPVPEESGNARGIGWDNLRHCESGANYAIADATGAYRGAYQFDLQTWRGMGGSGDPAEAPPAEQDLRAELLFRQRGAQPWPICGAHLLADPALVPPAPPDPDDPANAWLSEPPSTLGGGQPPGTIAPP